MNTYIWGRREQWVSCYFRNAFTMGHSTTQRPESWNDLVKCFKSDVNLVDLVKDIKILFQRQEKEERRSQSDLAYRISSFCGIDSNILNLIVLLVV